MREIVTHFPHEITLYLDVIDVFVEPNSYLKPISSDSISFSDGKGTGRVKHAEERKSLVVLEVISTHVRPFKMVG